MVSNASNMRKRTYSHALRLGRTLTILNLCSFIRAMRKQILMASNLCDSQVGRQSPLESKLGEKLCLISSATADILWLKTMLNYIQIFFNKTCIKPIKWFKLEYDQFLCECHINKPSKSWCVTSNMLLGAASRCLPTLHLTTWRWLEATINIVAYQENRMNYARNTLPIFGIVYMKTWNQHIKSSIDI